MTLYALWLHSHVLSSERHREVPTNSKVKPQELREITMKGTTTVPTTPVVPSDLTSIISPENVAVITTGICSVLANSVLLYVIFKNPLKIFRTRMSYLMISLGTADLITGLNGILFGILDPLGRYHRVLWCCFWISVLASVITVSIMSLERWSAILYPFKSGTIFTKRITIYICGGVWVFSVIGAVSVYFLPIVIPFILCTLMEVLLFLVVILYITTFHYFKQTQRRTSAVKEISHTTDKRQSSKTERRSSSRRMDTETQLLAVVLILVIILILTFIPYNLALQISYGCELFLGKTCDSVVLFAKYFYPFKFLNFILNPFVYAWRLPQYRKAFSMIFCIRRSGKTRVSAVGASIQAAAINEDNVSKISPETKTCTNSQTPWMRIRTNHFKHTCIERKRWNLYRSSKRRQTVGINTGASCCLYLRNALLFGFTPKVFIKHLMNICVQSHALDIFMHSIYATSQWLREATIQTYMICGRVTQCTK